MAKFKVGDKVRVIDFKENPPHWSRSGGMDKWKGKTVTLEKITRTNVTSDMEFSLREDRGECGFRKHKWVWKSSDFEPVETRREFIVIHRSGNVMTAEHRVNRDVIKSAKATCAPTDTFDLETGAKLAFDRLMGREEPKPAPKPAHKFKVGDLVKHKIYGVGKVEYDDGKEYCPYLVRFENDVGVECAPHNSGLSSGKNCSWSNESELSPAPAPEPPKFYTGKVVCISGEYGIGKVFTVRNGFFTDGCYNCPDKPYKSVDDMNSRFLFGKFAALKE